ncbi:glycosyltransferase family 9 protein [Sphingomonas sp.]|uniref:glycosyltransferase family 9 protein n=1 Tax=Sphingomonas sp. TaxID=28214 RepID=UPI003B3AF013
MINLQKRTFRFLVSRADAARDEHRYEAAAALFEEASRLRPKHAGVHKQAGHMFKEAGKFELAEAHYMQAQQLTPDDPDLALQLGHFYKLVGRPAEARSSYERATKLSPSMVAARDELSAITDSLTHRPLPVEAAEIGSALGLRPESFGGFSAGDLARLVPALAPRRHEDLMRSHGEEIEIRRFGRSETGFWGNRRTVRGVEALRGFCISETPIVEVQVLLDGIRIHRGPVSGGYRLKLESDPERIKKYVFNVWLDFASCPRGMHSIELRLIDAADTIRSRYEDVIIADPESEADWPDSDFLISLDPADPRSLDEQIRTRPSMVRSARRRLFPEGVRNVLVMRMDQLGDVVASIPAMMRLRELLPEANLVGLFTPANAELGRTLGIFSEIIVANFPDDRVERRRVMPIAEQEQLRKRLVPYDFDIAIDLAQSGASRDLLRLAGAKFTHATGGGDWPWLSSEFSSYTHDRWTRHDQTPHSSKVLALVETLGALLSDNAPILRRKDLQRSAIERFGIAADERYVVIHSGARIGFSQWPHYGALVASFLARSDLKVIMINDGPHVKQQIDPNLLHDPRLMISDGQLPFDDFDALLSFASVVVGNDSGPKHLAALRGTPVVTLFSARINWTEWGQENIGTIISRKMPCAGCAILHDAEECGRDFACVTDIAVNEVFDTAMTYVQSEAGALAWS